MAFRKVNLMSEKSILWSGKRKKNKLKACHRISLRMNSFLIMFESSLKILPINLEFCHQQRRMPKQVHFFSVVGINCDLFDRSLFEKSMNRALFKRKTNRYKKKTAKTFNLKPCFECSAEMPCDFSQTHHRNDKTTLFEKRFAFGWTEEKKRHSKLGINFVGLYCLPRA